MLTTLPLETLVCRTVLETYFFPNHPPSTQRHVILTTGLVLSSVLISLMTCDLGAVFEIIGATSACALAYILPPLCYIKLSRRSWKTAVAWVVMVFGTGVLVVSVILGIGRLVGASNSGGGGKTCG